MSEIDDDFRQAIATAVDADATEQLQNAARTVAASRPSRASVTSVRTLSPDEVPSVRALAAELACRYGLEVTFEERVSLAVRFSQ